MTLAEKLETSRSSYVTFYREKLKELRHSHPQCVAELLIQPNGAKNPAPFSLIRVDAIIGPASDPRVFQITLPVSSERDLAEFEYRGVRVEVGALSWESIEISFECPNFDLGGLRDWLSSWIDDRERRPVDDMGLAGALHSIGWNSTGAGLWELTVDFGSAPTTCILELFEKLGQQGVTNCIVETSGAAE